MRAPRPREAPPDRGLRARAPPPRRRRRSGRAHARGPGGRAAVERQFGAARSADWPKVRVLSPTVAEQGWASRHSVIEIVNDDMPFLVDSATAEIHRQGLALHLDPAPDLRGRARRPTVPPRCTRGATRTPARRANRGCTSRSTAWSMPAAAHPELVAGIERVLDDVCAAVEATGSPMLARLHEAAAGVRAGAGRKRCRRSWTRPRLFLEWLAEDHFTLLGYRQHDLVTEKRRG